MRVAVVLGAAALAAAGRIEVGVRPLWLAQHLDDGSPLKAELLACRDKPVKRSEFVLAHRGAPLQFPEHTRESYTAAYEQGAGHIECDTTFTKDRELVCRHSECDLHRTTDVLLSPLAGKCAVPFQPARGGAAASAKCCTSDFTAAEFKTLRGKMDGENAAATTAAEYVRGTPGFRTDLYSSYGEVMTANDTIALLQGFGVRHVPELKAPDSGAMPPDFPRAAFIDKFVATYAAHGVGIRDMFIQSFEYDDMKYLHARYPQFANQTVFLDERPGDKTWRPTLADFQEKKAHGVAIIAPPIYAYVALGGDNYSIVESEYSKLAAAAGLRKVAYSFERSGLDIDGDDYGYYVTVRPAIKSPADTLRVLDVLKRVVGLEALFSDWPATVTYYDNCVSG